MKSADILSQDAAAQLVADRFVISPSAAASWLEKRFPDGEQLSRHAIERVIAENYDLTKEAAIGIVMERTGLDAAGAGAWLAANAVQGRLKEYWWRRPRPYTLSELEAALQLRSPAPAGASPKKGTRDPRGAPLVYDRDAAYIELIRLANSPDGLPDGPAIKLHLKNWFAEQDLHPGKTWIDDFVRKILDGLNAR